MSKTPITISFDTGDGKQITIETGKLAKQAHGSVVVRVGDFMLLATIVSDLSAGEDIDFLPLTVDVREQYAAAGRFPGGFFKREARPSENEILMARIVDRAIRPLFPDDYHSNTFVNITLISSDGETLPDAYVGLAASAAISVSDIPFNGPISEVRVGKIDGQLVINPSKSELDSSTIDMIVAADMNNVIMVEGEMDEISEEEMIEAIDYAHVAIKKQCQAQIELADKVDASKNKRVYEHEKSHPELYEQMRDFAYEKCVDVASQQIADKQKRATLFKEIKEAFISTLDEQEVKENNFLIGVYYGKIQKEAVRSVMLDKQIRLDGRKLDEIRPIWTEVDYLPRAHGSAIFTRGETQSLSSVTLGSKSDEKIIDGVVFEGRDKFLLHYNFPAFSTGDARPNRGTSRREIGHGNLALRALKKVLPSSPYTIRIVSDILESNGSSSMATVCAGCLALMDAGIPIRKPVSGIAMGLVTDNTGRAVVLSDILGDEDHLGDMDFKVTGTKDGITACQMDIKIDGLTKELLSQALMQAKAGRLHILEEMSKTLDTPRSEYKPHAPCLDTFEVPKEDIGAIIGPGGKIIQEIQATYDVTITIEEVDDKGSVEIFGDAQHKTKNARKAIDAIIAKPEVGLEYDAKVVSIMPYGAFVEFMPGKQGLLHISEISWERIDSMEGVFKENEEVRIKLVDIDKQGRFRLSRKVLLPKPSKN